MQLYLSSPVTKNNKFLYISLTLFGSWICPQGVVKPSWDQLCVCADHPYPPAPPPPPPSNNWCIVRTAFPRPPSLWQARLPIQTEFWARTHQYPNRCHMDLWLAWLVLICHHHQPKLPLHQPRERISWLSIRLSFCLFSVKFPDCLELFYNSLSILSLAYKNLALESASAHADQPPAWPSKESCNLNGHEPEGSLS
jgi:hypothetical protein